MDHAPVAQIGNGKTLAYGSKYRDQDTIHLGDTEARDAEAGLVQRAKAGGGGP